MTISAQAKAFAIESIGIDPNGRSPDVAVLSDGRFVVVWQEKLSAPTDGFIDTDGAIFARIYNANGTASGDPIEVNQWLPGAQTAPHVVATPGGGFTVGFESTMNWGDTPTDADAFVVRFNAAGSFVPFDDTNPLYINSAFPYLDIDKDNPGSSDSGSFLVDAGNGYAALIREATDDNLKSVTLLGPDGNVVGQADAGTLFFQEIDSVARLSNGNVVIAGVYSGAVMVQMSDVTLGLAPEGIPGVYGPVDFFTLTSLPGAVDVKVTGLTPGSTAPGATQGGFVITALEPNGLNASSLVIESYSAWGAKQGGTAISIPISLNGTHPGYDVLALRDGTFVVAWTSKGTNGLDILASHFDSNGQTLGSSVVVQGDAASGDQIDPSLTQMADGKVMVVFTDLGSHAINGIVEPIHAVELTIKSSSGGYPATAEADVLNGTGGHDAIDGLAGDDTIHGLNGNDAVFGGDGYDKLYGDFGNDGLIGGNGNDFLYGGKGNDGLAGGAGVDLLKGGAGRDGLSGGLQADRLFGGAGVDRLDGGLGNDTLTGGGGADIFVFRNNGGTDVVTDFGANDYLRLDRALWAKGGDLSATQVLNQFAKVVGGDTVLTFADGESITLNGFHALVATDLQLI